MITDHSLDTQKHAIKDIGWNIHKMSFIIGAGFSKNISEKYYLSWWELMQDMVKEMYQKDISFHNMSTDDIIQKVGYLGIASEYVRRRGYHESIDSYIEKRTPVLVPRDKNYFDLVVDGKVMLEDVDMSLHNRLLNLLPKSIFTFNYDNALECNDERIYEPGRKVDPEKQKMLDELKVVLEKSYRTEYNHLIKTYQNYSKDISHGKSNKKVLLEAIGEFRRNVCDKLSAYFLPPNMGEIAPNKALEQARAIGQWLQEKIDGLEEEISNYRNNNDSYLLVKNSTDIAINTYKHTIIKLHGSLRRYDKSKHTFDGEIDFDNDHHTQYIIAQEDYDSYQLKHEAFVDLMRISLLRDSFCIIGFSCDDPNFLLWINWVKDINDLAKERNTNTGKKYYINVDSRKLPEDKLLLLENHDILVIDLFKIYKGNSPKERLKKFFEEIELQQDNTKLYKRMWQGANLWVSPFKESHINYDKQLIRLSWKDFLVKPCLFCDKAYEPNRLDVLRTFEGVISKQLLNEDITKLYCMATDKSNVPFTLFLSVDDEKNKAAFAEIHDAELENKISEDKVRQILLISGELIKDVFSQRWRNHYLLLSKLMNFDYDDYDKFLQDWKPTDKLESVYRQTFLNPDKNILERVENWTKIDGYHDSQEYFLALILLNGYAWDAGYNYSKHKEFKVIPDKISDLKKEHTNLIDPFNYVSDCLNRLKVIPEVSALGDARISIKFGAFDEQDLAGTKIINFLAKTGISPIRYMNKDQWLMVFKKEYRRYPAICLYYSSLYTDSSLTKFVAQAFTYDQTISQEFLNNAVIKMLHACIYYQRYINLEVLLTYATYFIKRVDPCYWAEPFKELFKQIYKEDSSQNDNLKPKDISNINVNFLYSGLKKIKDDNFKHYAIKLILSKQEYITEADNYLLAAYSHDKKHLRDDVRQQINKLLEVSPSEPIAEVIINFRTNLPEKHFKKWLSNVDKDILANTSILSALSSISKKKNSLRPIVFDLLDYSHFLWSTGVLLDDKGERVTSIGDTQCLYIQEIEQFISLPKHNVLTVFKKSKSRINEIEKATRGQWLDMFTAWWSNILVSIKCFLIKHEVELSQEKEYHSLLTKCDSLYEKITGVSSPSELLFCKEGSKVNNALFELLMLIQEEGIAKHYSDVSMLLQTIIAHNGKSIGECFSLVLFLLGKYTKNLDKPTFKYELKMILNRFWPYFDKNSDRIWNVEADKDEVEDALIKIRDWLNKHDVQTSTWAEYKSMFC